MGLYKINPHKMNPASPMTTDDPQGKDTLAIATPRKPATSYFRPIPVESRRFDVAALTLELHQLLDLGPGENTDALHRVGMLVASLKKVLPKSHFRDDRLRDLATDFALWFSKAPRLQFDYNDEALRSMLLVDIHRISGSP